VIYFLRV